ncbi:L7Ae/L30e/S12e/Gadd45 family ribosomal protein [Desulforudis sp. 1088]|uniref:L7Ae/L30e/S12e/Gadd45 family ribosomal protein n=1 Tax=unclassified Candidatus Desulforudis TaxID=2635950 RepID=UPI003CE49E3B
MPFERLTTARRKTVGTKQTLKAVQRGQAKVVFVAQDAEAHVSVPLIQACQVKGIPIVEVPTMRELGKLCGILVNCASAAVIED